MRRMPDRYDETLVGLLAHPHFSLDMNDVLDLTPTQARGIIEILNGR